MTDPYSILEKKDSDHKFLCLCSYVSICENKKMNLANVLLLALKEKQYKWIFLNILEVENEFEAHRKKTLEREQKLRRQLHDEINKNRNS